MTVGANALLQGSARSELGIRRKRKFTIGLCFGLMVFKKYLPGWGSFHESRFKVKDGAKRRRLRQS
jgi:hypothetical protein